MWWEMALERRAFERALSVTGYFLEPRQGFLAAYSTSGRATHFQRSCITNDRCEREGAVVDGQDLGGAVHHQRFLQVIGRPYRGDNDNEEQHINQPVAEEAHARAVDDAVVAPVGLHAAATLCRHLPAAALGEYASPLEAQLRAGLCDNWSQVRYAASTATRACPIGSAAACFRLSEKARVPFPYSCQPRGGGKARARVAGRRLGLACLGSRAAVEVDA